MQSRSTALASLTVGCLMACPALSADAFTDGMQAAYVPYRAALLRTNSKAQAEAEQATALAQQAWKTLGERFAAKPPAPYDRDAQFAATLGQVAVVYERAAEQVKAQRLAEAHETLEQARDLMADLRQRNDVVIYSDHMNAYHAQMELVLKDGAKPVASQQDSMQLMAGVGALDYLATRLRSDAPAGLMHEPDFISHLQAVEASVAALRHAVLSADAQALRAAVAKLKGPYSRMFLKYG
ncbi:MAG: hypothetical protein ACRC2B_10265 [Rubrivivax sp.]